MYWKQKRTMLKPKLSAAALLLLSPTAVVLGGASPIYAEGSPCNCRIIDGTDPGLFQILPNETGVTSEIANAPNIVIADPNQRTSKKKGITVFLQGTIKKNGIASNPEPELSTCLLKAIAEEEEGIVIGLSYQENLGDCHHSEELLNNTTEQVECLAQQHHDVLYGGSYGSDHSLWDKISYEGSVMGRLSFLIPYMIENYPGMGFNHLLKGEDKLNLKKVKFVGAAHGASHATYFSQQNKVKGVAMISGPQDWCKNCAEETNFWIDDEFKTKSFTAFASTGQDLFKRGVMTDNWDRMGVYESSDNLIMFSSSFEPDQARDGPVITALKPNPSTNCSRCSLYLNPSLPIIEIYSNLSIPEGKEISPPACPYVPYQKVWAGLVSGLEGRKGKG